ncbi:MAG: hypothetical protein SFW08_01055 [Gemmatimonadaceae bacterium]|nr:hypothetical protein [Gemmatimonadaceae bacterium]
MAQVQVRDSLGAPVPFAILESASGKRLVAGADGLARAAALADGPWSARRIGYRPGADDDRDGLIVLGRSPLALPTQYVAASGSCTRDLVAARSPEPVLDAVRAVLLEGSLRREIAGARVSRLGYRTTTRLITEQGDSLDGGTHVETHPTRRPGESYVPGRAIEGRKASFVVNRPGLRDVLSPTFLDAHCLAVASGEDETRAVIRFVPIDGAKGSHVLGTFVVDRATGRILEDTLRYVGAPRGLPQQAVDVAVYLTDAADPFAGMVPSRLVNTFEPHEMFVQLPAGRRRIVRIERVLAREPSADQP